MVIKSKKWKSNIGFLSFFLSVSLLLTGGSGLASGLLSYGTSESFAAFVSETDYQNTKEFQNFISDELMDFLAMAAGDYVYSYGFEEAFGYSGSADNTTEVVVESTAVSGTENFYPNDYPAWERDVSYTETQKKQSAEYFHNQIKQDKNVLYVISYDGKELYSNREDTDWDGTVKNLPENYNFCLHYDSEAVNVWKDGKQLDIYGDGIYREGEDWRLPGYLNYTVPDKWQKADIVLLVAKEPVQYVETNGSNTYYGNTLYYMRQEFFLRQKALRFSLFCIALGCCFFLLYLKLRREKQLADAALAKLTGKLWFEAKLLLLFLLPLFAAGMAGTASTLEETTVVLSDISISYDGYYYDSVYLKEVFRTVLNSLLNSPALLVVLFWVCYLFCNDIGKNKGSFRHGIFGKIAETVKTRDLTLSLSKRLMAPSKRLFLCLTGSCLLSVVLFLAALLFGFSKTIVLILFEVPCALLLLLSVAAFFSQKKSRKLALELEELEHRIREIHDGAYESGTTVMTEDSALQQMTQQLEEIRQGMETAVEERLKSERMKVELVANVSHDIKTPLTSIISYIELLKQEDNLPEDVKDYIHILDEKAERLKNMVQDVFSVSKAASGQLSVELEELDFGRLLNQTLADMDEEIKRSPAVLRAEIPDAPVMVRADGHRMYRVFQNLIGNALKYSLEGSRIYITLEEKEGFAVACIRNTSKNEIKAGVDFTARFTRGDESRTDGGSGLGLSIAKSFTEACGGTFTVETMADLFVVKVSFGRI